MYISIGRNRQEKHWVTKDVTFKQLCAKLEKTKRTTETMAQYLAMTRDEQTDIKDVGGFVGGRLEGGIRKRGHVRDNSLITLDLDDALPTLQEDWELVCGFDCCMYSTHKHTPGKPRMRLLIPTARIMTTEEYEPIARRVAEMVGIAQFDPTTYQDSRLFFWPSTAKDGEYIFWKQCGGNLLDPDKVLATYHDWRNPAEWPVGPTEDRQALKLVTGELKKAEPPQEKRGLIGAFCRCYSVPEAMETFLPGVYLPTDKDDRYTYAQGTTAGGLVIYDGGDFCYSNHSTDPAHGRLCNAFDIVRLHKFGYKDGDQEAEDVTTLPSYAAMMDFCSTIKDVVTEQNRRRIEEARNDLADFAAGDEPEEDKSTWMADLRTDKKGNPIACIPNFELIMRNDKRLAGHIRLNKLSGQVTVFGGLPWRTDAKVWKDSDNGGLRSWFDQNYWLKGKDMIKDAKGNVAEALSYHPIRDYLSEVRWDGVKRLDTVIINCLGSEDNTLTRFVTRQWLIAAVARIFEPGIKFDQCLILAGPQGAYKTTFFELMGGSWYNGNLSAIGLDKSQLEQLQGSWIFELQELDQMKRKESSAVKAFLSNCNDRYRGAYKEDVEDHPRQCVFGGSTNEDYFLSDDTGDRRFWLVRIDPSLRRVSSPREAIIEQRDQLWAEAYAAYRAGEFNPVMGAEEAKQMSARCKEANISQLDPTDAMVEVFLNTKLPADWPAYTIQQRRIYYQCADDIRAKGCEERTRACAAEFVCEYLGREKSDAEYRYKAARFFSVMRKKYSDTWKGPDVSRHVEDLYGRQKTFFKQTAEDENFE